VIYVWQVNQRKKKLKKGHVALIMDVGQELEYMRLRMSLPIGIRAEISGDEKYWVNKKDRGTRR